jgi:hypothetical protein
MDCVTRFIPLQLAGDTNGQYERVHLHAAPAVKSLPPATVMWQPVLTRIRSNVGLLKKRWRPG